MEYQPKADTKIIKYVAINILSVYYASPLV